MASSNRSGSSSRRIRKGQYATAKTHADQTHLHVLERVLLRLHVKTGRPVALVGHSRGGHFAKALAARHPDGVRAVVSLGSGLDEPFDISVPTKAAVTVVRSALRRLDPSTSERGCLTSTCDCPFTRDYAAPFPDAVPITSVWSKGDGVVRWRACVVPYAANVEVRGSHVGLAFNRHAYREIARTLAPPATPTPSA